jgi:pyruvate formate lyase activating enzyme
MTGQIHSIETMGLQDGPGIRFTVFMQGCPLRCVYCHNPDTWSVTGGEAMTPEALLEKALRYKAWLVRSGGGITVTGGEPLLQSAFVTAFFKLCKLNGLHTTLDTSGAGYGDHQELLNYTDLVLLDLKGATSEDFKKTTGVSHNTVLPFHKALKESGVDVWVRYVVVPGLNDDAEKLKQIETFASSFTNMKRIEWLPYHALGIHKYEALGMTYNLVVG